MKKLALLSLTILTAAALLVGCGGNETPTQTAPAATAAQTVTAAPAPAETQPAGTEAPAPLETQPAETAAPTTAAPTTAAPETTPALTLEVNPLLEGMKWTDGAVVVDGVLYQSLKTTMPELIENGWDFNFSNYNIKATDKLQPGAFVSGKVTLLNPKFSGEKNDGPAIRVGFANISSEAKPYKECTIRGIEVKGTTGFQTWENSYYQLPCYDFELPGGLRRGSTLEEVRAVYGEPSHISVNEGVYEAWSYSVSGSKIEMRLEIYYDYGLQTVQLDDSRTKKP